MFAVLMLVLVVAFALGLGFVRRRKAPTESPPVWRCSECGARFLHQRGLIWHIRASHEGDLPWSPPL